MSKVSDFSAVKVKLASPSEILEWSHGEVLKPETINYRTQRPEMDGLFCERIFGPTKDWECYCGKYKRIRYKGIVCDKCGVEVTRSVVRRERMGHIKLAVPVSHIWFLRGVPSGIGLILDKSVQELEKVVYFASYIITEVDEKVKQVSFEEIDREYKAKLKKRDLSVEEKEELKKAREAAREELKSIRLLEIVSEVDYRNLSMKFASVFKASIGAEALRNVLSGVVLENLVKSFEKEIETSTGLAQKKKLIKRVRMVRGLIKANIRPEWMCFTVLPVIPPELRPMVQLDGGRFATSDLNDLYRRVINRNNRLKRLMELGAPEVICRNEKRMLQEAVDALIDNSVRHGQAAMAATGQKRQLRSLADMLKGKQGRFRQNLLGKRVDYSGRSVIVVGPELKLHQCGLPKKMALELFKPFVIKKLIENNFAFNVRSAGKLIEQETNEVWDILDEVIKGRTVLLNRAPTLHRLGIQAFEPMLIEGKAIQIHPMVCKAFNADFDGDQMAVHLPLTSEAQNEAKEIMLSAKNLLKPATGDPIVIPSQDIVLGVYYMTKIKDGIVGEGEIFLNKEAAILAYQMEKVNLKAKIKIKNIGSKVRNTAPNTYTETSVGRILFNESLPSNYRYINQTMDAKALKGLIADVFEKNGQEETVLFADRIKEMGFKYITKSGLSWGMDDLRIPVKKKELFDAAEKQVEIVREQYEEGLLTDDERKTRVIEVWTAAKDKVAEEVKKTLDPFGSVFSMIDSGARGNWPVVTQMMGTKGLVVSPTGETIELPIKSSFKEGFNVLEYFISTHGARKGMTDIALRTSTAGYLTRRLVDVAQDVVIRETDCGEDTGMIITKKDEVVGRDFAFRIRGRTALEDIINPATKEVIVVKDGQITKGAAERIVRANVEQVKIRSIVKCRALRGLCQDCYGFDLGKNKLVEMGQAVGIVTAQAIGEPGTQLTMRTFHTGGVAGRDITQGLPRVEEIFEAREPKGKAYVSEVDGLVEEIEDIKDGKLIKIKCTNPDAKAPTAEYTIPHLIALEVAKGDLVVKGQQLTEGHVELQELFRLGGVNAIQDYILKEIYQIYFSQGEGINDKHVEIIVRQMLSRLRIVEAGDTALLVGDVVERAQFEEENIKAKAEGKQPAQGEVLLMGITKASLSTESFLSAASFQETARVLINASLAAKEDKLRGLKENVIIGRLIPAGTGFRG